MGSYSTALQTSRLRPGFNPETIFPVTQYYPAHMAQFRSSWDLGRRWMLDAEVYRTGALKHNGEDSMPGWTRADIRLERRLGERSGIYVNGQNLLHRSQAEFVGNLFFPAGSIGRSISVGLRWEQ